MTAIFFIDDFMSNINCGMGKNNGQGKVREFYFGPKVREKSGNFVLNCHENLL